MVRRTVLTAAAAMCLGTSIAEARPYNDVTIYRDCGGAPAPCELWLRDYEYRKVIQELGLMISPKVMSPSSTLGINGFDAGIEVNTALLHGQELYWTKAAQDETMPRVFSFPTLRVRKGLPLSLEGGMNISYLPFTSQQVIGGDARFAVHEGFSLVPDVAIQLSYAQYIGNEQLDMNVKQGSATLGYTWAFGDLPGIHTGRVSAWGGYAKGIIDSTAILEAIPGDAGDPASGPEDAWIEFLDLDRDGSLALDYDKWVVGLQVESGGFTYLINGEFVDGGIPTINMRWGAQF